MGDAKVKECSSCGEAAQSDAAFCTRCGNRFMENADIKNCSSCGETMKRDDAFCARCGSPFDERQAQGTGEGSLIRTQLLELANDFLSVREVTPERFEFSSQTGAQAPVQKVKIKYDAVAQLKPEKKQLTFWEQMVESSVGMNTGFSAEKSVQKGTEFSQKKDGHILFGGKYGFEYGNLREVVKAIAAKQGWKFKALVSKPKKKGDEEGKDSGRSGTVLKILVAVLALLLIMALGVIGYLVFSAQSNDVPPPFQESTPTPSEDELKTVDGGLEKIDAGSQGMANEIDKTESAARKVLRKQGTVAGGKPFIETDRNIYHDGEEIRVLFYNAPGYSRDWICIVPAGALNTVAGDYQYIPKQGRGVLTFKSPPPGRYEARAFYSYSAGRYVVSTRYGFTVQDR